MVTKLLGTAVCVLVLATAAHAQSGALGKNVFEKKGNCATCHGPNGSGSPLAPSLRDTVWLNIDGSLEQIKQIVRTGVARPKKYPGMMPPMGGAQLKAAEIEAVAEYVAGLHKAGRDAAAGHDHSENSVAAAHATPGHGCWARHRGRQGAMWAMHGRRRMHFMHQPLETS